MTQGKSAEANPIDPQLESLMREEVSRAKDEKIPVIRAFEAIAEKSGLKLNTVRNYYYRYIHEQNQKRKGNVPRKKFSSKKSRAIIGRSFTDDEVRELMITMLQAQANGEAVRACANRLADNDPKLMLRYQNKYRNMLARNPDYVKELMREMSEKGMRYYNPFTKQCVGGRSNMDKKATPKKVEVADSNLPSKLEDEDLLDILGQLVSNIREIEGRHLEDFFKGLRDISEMAVKYKKQEDQSGDAYRRVEELESTVERQQKLLKEKDYQLEELNARVLSYQARLEEENKRNTRLASMLHQLLGINRNFLNLSSAGKVSGLQEYARELEACMKDYDRAEQSF